MNTQSRFSSSKRSRHPLVYAIVFIIIVLPLGFVPTQVKSQSARVCDPQVYHGVLHCTEDNGDTHLILVDLTNPHVRVQTVLPINPTSGEECNSVNAKNHPDPAKSDTTSNCPFPYPTESVKDMLTRYVGGFRISGYSADRDAVAIINTDYFGPGGDHGAQGLAVRIEERLDGLAHNDDDAGEFRGSHEPSLAVSPSNIATIGRPGSEQVIDDNLSGTYYNSVGGAPIIVDGGELDDIHCTSPYPGTKCSQPSQSAAGLTNDGRLVLITARRNAGDIATHLITNYQVQTALKFDGGGSASMAWVDSTGDVKEYCSDPEGQDPNTGEPICRKVAEGLLIFSERIQSTGTVDVALIIDSSGSMGWNDPANKRLDAAKAYLTASLEGDFVGVVDFDSGVRLASPLLRLPENKTTLIDAIDTINSSGGTNIGIGVQEGCNALIDSTSENTTKAAILLTDGEGAFAGQDSCFRDRQWPIYTFGFGSANAALLEQIAANTGGEFAWLPTSDLVCEFQRVRSKIAGVEPGPCSVIHIGPLEITIFVVTVPSGQEQVSFSISWTGSDVEMALTTPSGRVIDRNTVAPDVIHDLDPAFEIYTILNPEPGDWEVSLFGADVPSGGEDVVFSMTTIPESPTTHQPPSLIIPVEQSVQYSDLLSFDVSATDPDDPGNSLTFSAIGLPDGLSVTDNGDGTATVAGVVQAASGTYNVEIVVTDPQGLSDTETVPIVVSHEDATVAFNGDNPVAVQVAEPSGNSGLFSLTAYVSEKQPDEPTGSSELGDISLADVSVSLMPVGPGGSVAGVCVPGTVTGSGYDTQLPVTCEFDDVPVNTYSVQVTVGGGYYTGSAEDVLVVYDPSLGFTTGGGWFYWPGTTEKTNFGYTMKYNKKGQKVRGNLLLIRHLPDGSIYRIKSNALNGLALGDEGGFGWASFSGKSTYLEPGLSEPEGNHEFLVYVEDHNEPGTGFDQFWIEVKDKDREIVLMMSMERPATGNTVQLEGGNIVVPHGGGGRRR